jgi:hypothetical protein
LWPNAVLLGLGVSLSDIIQDDVLSGMDIHWLSIGLLNNFVNWHDFCSF